MLRRFIPTRQPCGLLVTIAISPLLALQASAETTATKSTAAAAAKAKAASDKGAQLPPSDQLLVTLRENADPLRRESAAIALGDSGQAAATAALLQGLAKDTNLWVRSACAAALGKLGDRKAIPALARALTREKRPRARRTIAKALVRLGQQQGVDELLWQLKTENQNAKADVMTFLAATTGQALGQDQQAWWRYFSTHGTAALRARVPGGPSTFELGGLRDAQGQPFGPWLYGTFPSPWIETCGAVLLLKASHSAVTPGDLVAYQRSGGEIPDGCVLLIRTGWRAQAQQPPPAPSANADATSKPTSKPKASDQPIAASGPGLTEAAVRYLLERAPHLRGIAADTPRLDLPGAAEQPVLNLLRAHKRLAIEAVDGLDTLLRQRLRLVIVKQQSDGLGGHRILLLAIVP